MELLNEMILHRIRSSLLALSLTGLLGLGSPCCGAPSPGEAASGAKDPYIAGKVRAAKVVFVGSVVRLLPSDCVPSGLVPSRQGIVFELRRVLKGDTKLRGEFTAYHSLTGGSPLEVDTDGCITLSAEIFEVGKEFIVACDQYPEFGPSGRWVITGGPWLMDRSVEKMVSNAIAKGDIDIPQQIWLGREIDISRFIQGEEVSADSISRAIRFFEDLTLSPSSQHGKAFEEISRSGLQTDLEIWKEWYEKHQKCLVYDKSKLEVVISKNCMDKDTPIVK